MFRFRLRQSAPIPLDIDLSLEPGELHALVGPSGSGKTTCLRALAGLIPIQQGRIQQDGDAWFDSDKGIAAPAYRRPVGLVFQSYALFPHLSALGNVVAALDWLPRGQREAKAAHWLERVRLKGLEKRLPNELSGGQQQRVAMARALAREPAILLLDEPFAAVDQRTRERLYRELALLRRELSMPILMVTHDLNEARLLADRMTVLYHGKALATAAPDMLVHHPPSVPVARLLGQTNLFEGTIVDGSRLLWQDRHLELPAIEPFAVGDRVVWTIAPASVLLHRRDRPSRGERENPIHGKIVELVALADQVQAKLQPNTGPPLALTLSRHAAARNALELGCSATVSLLADGIHLMPASFESALSKDLQN